MEKINNEVTDFTSRPTLAIVTTMILLIAMTILLTYFNVDQHEAAGIDKHGAATSAANVKVAGSTAPAAALPDFTALVKKSGPAVINISTPKGVRAELSIPASPGIAQEDPFSEFFRRFAPGGQSPHKFTGKSLGSGFIVSPDGYILTNAHVVYGATEIAVRLTDQREFKATLIGVDKRCDIALLKIDAKDLPVIHVGDAPELEVGEWVVAIGAPFGYSNSVSQGIVSSKGRNLPGDIPVPFIQTDVPIDPGNSGGPLFNINGEVIGINSQIDSRSGGYTGLSFAIPIRLAMKVKDKLLQHGTIRHGMLGVTAQNVTVGQALSFRLKRASGALIAGVMSGGPADRAGIRIGDIILKLNGKLLVNADEMVRTVAESAPGSIAKLKVWRNAGTIEISVKLGESDSGQPAQKLPESTAQPRQLGLNLHELRRELQHALHTEGSFLV